MTRRVSGGTAFRDLRVIEVSRTVAGAYCGRLMADTGAEIIAIESPNEPHFARRLGPYPDDVPDDESSGLHHYLNANKRAISLDLETAAGQRVLDELLAEADVLVSDMVPSELRRLRLCFEHRSQSNPRLIACAITPFGLTGPYSELAGEDIVVSSLGGITGATPGFPDYVASRENERPLRAETFTAGFISGPAGAAAVIAALFARLMDGQGRQIDVSQHEAVASTMIRDIASYSYAGIVSGRRTEEEQSGTAYAPNIYLPCKDGMVVLVTASEEGWRKLVEVMGSPAWARSEEFKDSKARAANINELVSGLIGWTMGLSGSEITRMTQSVGLPCAHVLRISEMADSDHVQARNSLIETEIGGRRCRMPGPPFRIDGVFGDGPKSVPCRGEHTNSVLRELLGYSETDLKRLKAVGAT